MERIQTGRLQVSADLHAFIRNEAIPGAGLDEATFWRRTEEILEDLAPRLHDLLHRREVFQNALDEVGSARGAVGEEDYLRSLGYLVEEPADFQITTSGVDTEISEQPGPQLVVPLLNARFAINAANARWGSLYDALYGSDVIAESMGLERTNGYNTARGDAVVSYARSFLDEHFALTNGSHANVTSYSVVDGNLRVALQDGQAALAQPDQLAGYVGSSTAPSSILLRRHGLHVEIQVDREHPVGARDQAGVQDVVLESAVTAIMDLEDSVAAVDSADKVAGYRNWLGLMQRSLQAEVVKGDHTFTRVMNGDRTYTAPSGGTLTLPGTSLLFIRQVGHHMFTDAVLDADGRPIPEGILDALVTGLCSKHDVEGPSAGKNSRKGAIYVVKPKMHGPAEVAFACEMFRLVERALGLMPLTIKIGIMDEERRTSANLKACIWAARDRVAFINTGFLDRTGDEIRTSTFAGAMVRKAAMKNQPWIRAYEEQNVDIALECGFLGRAQIGKGMWAAPDNLADMLRDKVAHPQAGASCAWVPSPTAATLHALHYHQVDVHERQRELLAKPRRRALADLLTIPLGTAADWSDKDRRDELDNNVQSTLGYVVRWVDAGIGCSKVPDRSGTPLMEDRATCRISAQLVSNWLLHGVVTRSEVEASLRRMALIVDEQNAAEVGYEPMAPDFDGEAFLAARELLLEGVQQPAGYTEPILHSHRLSKKAEQTRSHA
ncbi:malate synthase G [Nocardioides endophyticus]|uniref:Malate synthase G n=1 Tax=Nocardioides endophyticus TaxID=1353775 RepID=A0ABP8YI11_9ACTN